MAVLWCLGVPGWGGRSDVNRGRVCPGKIIHTLVLMSNAWNVVFNLSCCMLLTFLSFFSSYRGIADTMDRLPCLAPSYRTCLPSSATSWWVGQWKTASFGILLLWEIGKISFVILYHCFWLSTNPVESKNQIEPSTICATKDKHYNGLLEWWVTWFLKKVSFVSVVLTLCHLVTSKCCSTDQSKVTF